MISSPSLRSVPTVNSAESVSPSAGNAFCAAAGAQPPGTTSASAQSDASARWRQRRGPAALALIAGGTAAKGDVLGVARVAAIQGAKRTSELVPLCHPIAITRVAVEFELLAESNAVRCTAEVATVGRTGV